MAWFTIGADVKTSLRDRVLLGGFFRGRRHLAGLGQPVAQLGEDEEEPEASENEAAADQPEVEGHWDHRQCCHLRLESGHALECLLT